VRLLVGGLGLLLFGQAYAAGFDCLIEPAQAIEVGSPVAGLIDRVQVRRGDKVGKGQIIAMLESRAEQAAAELARFKSEAIGPTKTAEAKLKFSRRKFERRGEMAVEKLMSEQERDDAEAEYRLAEAELLVAKENKEIARIEFDQQSSLLRLRTIRSPFDGVVVDQLMYPGEVVEPGGTRKTILKLAQLDPLRIHVILPMAEFGKIKLGMSADVSPESPIGGKHSAKVKIIDKLVDAASGTFAAFLEMSNPQFKVPAGVKCTAEFAFATEPKRGSPANKDRVSRRSREQVVARTHSASE
jgi:RND family efflux transporter MFP subunit